MAREIKKGIRMVFTGSNAQPDVMWVEYQIIDGELAESPKRISLKEVGFNAKIQSLWSDMLAQVRTAEKL